MADQAYARTIELEINAFQAAELVTRVFTEEGFSIQYQLDMQGTFRDRLSKDYGFYTIIGICDPNLAYQGLELTQDLGLVIPCNVVVRDRDGGGSVIKAIDSIKSWALLRSEELLRVAEQAEQKVRQALDRVARES